MVLEKKKIRRKLDDDDGSGKTRMNESGLAHFEISVGCANRCRIVDGLKMVEMNQGGDRNSDVLSTDDK